MTHMAFGDTKIKCAVSRGLGEGRRRTCLDNETSRVGPSRDRGLVQTSRYRHRGGPVRAGMAMGKAAMAQASVFSATVSFHRYSLVVKHHA
jgi:hypothetical protein